MSTFNVFGERSLTLVAGLFRESRAALIAADTLRDDMPVGDIDVVHPGDPQLTVKLEPENRGIWHTLLASHLWLGLAGMAFGLLWAAALVLGGWPAASDSPALTALFSAVMGLFIGMMFAGLLTLRPDHGRVIDRVREATRKGSWAVVAHPLDEAQAARASAMLKVAGAEVVRSF